MSRANQFFLKFSGLKDGSHKFEYDLDNMPAEYMINLFRAISKYPQYDYLVDEILAIIISELGETV